MNRPVTGSSAPDVGFPRDALHCCVLPTTASGLVAADGSGRATQLPLFPQARELVVACSRRPDDLPWIATKERLYVLPEGGSGAVAFELGVRPYNSASDLAGLAPGINAGPYAGAHHFFVNSYDDCRFLRLVGGELEQGPAFPGRVFATAAAQDTLFAAGLTPDPAGERYPSPLLLDVPRQRAIELRDLDAQLRQLALRSQAARLPSKYIVERLHCDAFLACAPGPGGTLAIVGGVAEATLATDLDAPDEPETVPQLSNYVGVAFFRLVGVRLQVDEVDLGYRYLASVDTGERSPVYLVTSKQTHGQVLGDVAVHLEWPAARERPVPLSFSGCSPDTPFNKMSVAYRKGCGYLAVVNTFWGDRGSTFAPRDLFLTSPDGRHWSCAGTSDG
jgi:hypothetical protein